MHRMCLFWLYSDFTFGYGTTKSFSEGAFSIQNHRENPFLSLADMKLSHLNLPQTCNDETILVSNN